MISDFFSFYSHEKIKYVYYLFISDSRSFRFGAYKNHQFKLIVHIVASDSEELESIVEASGGKYSEMNTEAFAVKRSDFVN